MLGTLYSCREAVTYALLERMYAAGVCDGRIRFRKVLARVLSKVMESVSLRILSQGALGFATVHGLQKQLRFNGVVKS